MILYKRLLKILKSPSSSSYEPSFFREMQNLTVLESAGYGNLEEFKVVCAEYSKKIQQQRRLSFENESPNPTFINKSDELRTNHVNSSHSSDCGDSDVSLIRHESSVPSDSPYPKLPTLNEQNALKLVKETSSIGNKDKTKKDRKVLHPQAKELILNVVNFMKQESNGEFSIPPRKVQCRAAMATGFSERTIRRVVKESKTLPVTENSTGESSSVIFPPKKVPNRPKPKTGLDALTRCAVRKIIHKIYVNEKTVPTIKKIHEKLVEELGFKGGSRSAHKIVKELGFYWKKTKAKSYVLMEKHEIRLKRIEFLRDITRLRHEGRPVIYIDDGSIAPSHGCTNWTTAVIVGGDRGCVPGTLLVTEEPVDLTSNLASWVREALIPALPPGSVLVFDSTSRLVSSCQDRIPTLESDAEAMKHWLTAKGIPYRPDMLRPELHQLIRRKTGRIRKHKGVVEQALMESGHTTLKIPPDHPDLNAAALIWTDLRRALCTDTRNVRVILDRRLEELGPGTWTNRCSQVRSVEHQYLASEGIVDAEVERVLTANKQPGPAPESVDDMPDNIHDNINFVRHFMGGLLGLDDHKLYGEQ